MRTLSLAFIVVISMAALAGAQRPPLFDGDGHFVQMDRHALVPDRVRAICPSAHPKDFNALIKEQDEFVDSVQKHNASASAWLGLACRRALLFAMGAPGREGPMMVAGVSWASVAVDETIQALTLEPANLRAAQLLSVIGFAVTSRRYPALNEREHLPPEDGWVEAVIAPAIVPRMASLIYRAVQLGIRDSSVLRACTSLMFDAGDAGTAHDCSTRALALGSDSTWHLLRLTWLAVLHSDTAGAAHLFASAMRSAHNPDARAEIGWHFEDPCQEEHACGPGGILIYRLAMDEKLRWLTENDSAAGAWFVARLAGIAAGDTVCNIGGACSGHLRRQTRTANGVVGGPTTLGPFDHFSAVSYAGATFRACALWNLERVPCWATLNPYDAVAIDVAAQVDHLWDPSTGNPVDLVPYTIVGNDFAAKDSAGVRTAFVDLVFRRWGSGSSRDTAVRLALTLPAHGAKHPAFTDFMVMPTVTGLDGWSLMATQLELRHGGVHQDSKPPLDTGPLVLSDIVLGATSQGLAWKTGGRNIVLAPQGVVARNEPVQLYYQVKSDVDRAGARTRVAVFAEGADRATAKPAMQIAFDSPIRRGLNEVERELGIAKLASGKYWFDVEVTDAAMHITSRRSVMMYVK